MPRRPRHDSKRLQAAVAGLVREVGHLLKAVQGAAVRGAPALSAQRTPGQRGPGKGNPKLKSASKSSWAKYTPQQRAARIAKMQAGRSKATGSVATPIPV